MSSAASKHSKSLGGSKRDRPSLSMSQRTNNTSNIDEIDDTEGNNEPLFMDDVQSQFESLSERLAKENNQTSGSSVGNEVDMHQPPRKSKVRWSDTVALASTLDAAKAGDSDNGDTLRSSSPLEVISSLFQKKYTLPVFLLMATCIFLMVHLTGRDDGGSMLYSNKIRLSSDATDALSSDGDETPDLDTTKDSPLSPNLGTRSFNIGKGDGFSSLIFSFVPTPTPGGSASEVPTTEAILHITPKMGMRAGAPSPSVQGDETDWILIPTSSKGGQVDAGGVKEGFGFFPDVPTAFQMGIPFGPPSSVPKWNFPDGMPTPDPALLKNGSPVTLSWGFPPGVPTPDPALLNNGSPVTLSWGFPPGAPTPDPALLNNGSPVTLSWGYPPGVPTPDPALLNNGSPVTLSWGYPPGVPTPDPALLNNGSPVTLSWGYPPGVPTPNPDLLADVVPDDTAPTTLMWQIPLGQPTPDPASLKNGSPVSLSWGYPPGVPTPDPALLAGVPDSMTWGYPPGVPTPDPALLNEVVDSMTWGYPPGVPTPDPGLLSGTTTSPTLRNVESGIPPPTKKEDILVKMPEFPGASDAEAENDDLGLGSDPLIEFDPEKPVIILGPKDSNGNAIEIAPPAPAPKIPINLTNPPTPLVVTRPWTGHWLTRPHGSQRPHHSRPLVPIGFNIGGGYVMAGGCGGCGCGCCGCGGGMQYNMQNFDSSQVQMYTGINLPGMPEPECPWECMIDETVPTMGRSNEDDAIYEIFYSNPLNCCGIIVEIGAGNGKKYSTSYFFEYGMNWTSILTEADPMNFQQIANERTGDKTVLINGAFCQDGSYIYFDEESRLFQTNAGEYSSEALNRSLTVTDSTTKVDCIRLDSNVLSNLDHVNVMIIRVKGDPWAVVRSMNWDVTVDIWVILMENRAGMLHDTLRAALKLHDYVPAAWDIKLWCETPTNCLENEVWLRKSFSALPKPLLGSPGLRGSIE